MRRWKREGVCVFNNESKYFKKYSGKSIEKEGDGGREEMRVLKSGS